MSLTTTATATTTPSGNILLLTINETARGASEPEIFAMTIPEARAVMIEIYRALRAADNGSVNGCQYVYDDPCLHDPVDLDGRCDVHPLRCYDETCTRTHDELNATNRDVNAHGVIGLIHTD